jgi:hypothetical protein
MHLNLAYRWLQLARTSSMNIILNNKWRLLEGYVADPPRRRLTWQVADPFFQSDNHAVRLAPESQDCGTTAWASTRSARSGLARESRVSTLRPPQITFVLQALGMG